MAKPSGRSKTVMEPEQPAEQGCAISGKHPSPDLRRRLTTGAERLEAYALRIQKALASGTREDLYQALADVAEAHEIARRFSVSLLDFLQGSRRRN